MSGRSFSRQASFALLPAFTIGIKDGFNPCGMAAALIFIIYLALVGWTQKRVFFLGIFYILVAAITNYLLVIGVFDYFLMLPSVQSSIRIGYLLLAVVFLIFGVLNILDWWRYKKSFDVEGFHLKLPAFLNEYAPGRVISRAINEVMFLGFVFLAICSGFFMTFAEAIYPQNEYMFIVHSFLMAGGDRGFALQSFVLYSIAMVLPLVVIWFVVFCLGLKWRKRPKVISYYKGILSVLFLSVGIGLGYFFLR